MFGMPDYGKLSFNAESRVHFDTAHVNVNTFPTPILWADWPVAKSLM